MKLSQQELVSVKALMTSKNRAEAACKTGLTLNTLDTYSARVRKKLKCTRTSQAFALGLKEGWLP